MSTLLGGYRHLLHSDMEVGDIVEIYATFDKPYEIGFVLSSTKEDYQFHSITFVNRNGSIRTRSCFSEYGCNLLFRPKL